MSIEIELKLSADPEDLPRVLALDALRPLLAAPPVVQQLVSIYYDTPEGALRQRGVALRLRRVGSRWIQTLKSKGQDQDGLTTRQELETPSDGQALDFSGLDDAALRAFLESEALLRQLKPRFITDFERVTQLLRCADDTVIELAIDRGEVRTGARTAPISEIELELKSGNQDRLREVARLLQGSLRLNPESVSKAERGYRLLSPDEAP